MRRRDALVIGGAVAIALAIPPVLRRLPSDFDFRPVDGFPGFRKLSGGATSGGVDPFFGLGDTNRATEDSPKSPCLALFGAEGWPEGKVPVAIFTDFNCPYCKVLERRLVELQDSGAPIQLTWHDMPLLGPSSKRYAQAAQTARRLGAEERARAYLSSNPLRPGPKALRDLAEALDLPPDAFTRIYDSLEVAKSIQASISLGRRMGIPGTPGTVIGRTLVIGAIKDADIEKLIAVEVETPRTVCT